MNLTANGHTTLADGHSHVNGGHSHSNGHANGGHHNHGMTHEDGVPATVSGSSDSPKKQRKEQSSDSEQMNIRGVFLHVLADALGSVVVIISAGVILLTDEPADTDALDPRS
jgi:Co/Zn/Cd efflux system component